MESVTPELRRIIREFSEKFNRIPDAEFSAKPLPNKWSKKEVVGHLVDSGLNNIRRFICGQYESNPNIVYDQDFWVKVNDYQNVPQQDVVAEWKLVNERICSVLTTMPPENYSRTCNTGKQTEQLHTLEWLAIDYVKHMKHHINQIIPKSFEVSYP